MIATEQGDLVRDAGEFIGQIVDVYGERASVGVFNGMDVVRANVRAGGIACVNPDGEGPGYVYIVDGTATWYDGKQSVPLGAGDSVWSVVSRQSGILFTDSNVHMIYMSRRPVIEWADRQASDNTCLAMALADHDRLTADHCRRIQRLALRVGRRLGLGPVQLYYLALGALLHDLGKIDIPACILHKPGALTPAEWDLMKSHTVFGRNRLMRTSLAPAAMILEQHHERLDGSGYPHGLSGDEISTEAQIVAVVDSYDAMTTPRSYRPAMSHAGAVSELVRGSGTFFRSVVVDAMLDVLSSRVTPW